jgi:mRNA interferase RelE/StbE
VNSDFTESFLKDLRAIKDRGALRRVRELIESVEQAQSLVELSNIKKLKGGGHYYRVRVGDYRIGLLIEKGIVTFVRALNRKEIYRYFP